jgi:glycosyltransferase involved in cell wall biosynthesis
MSSKKKIVTLHSLDTIQERFKILIRIYNYVENVIVHSEDMRKLLKNNGVFERKIFNVFHGVKIPPIYDLNRTEITFLGAPEERKGILTVLNALQILKNKNIKVFVSIYGIYSGEEKIWAEKEAELRGIKNHLIWGGRLSEEDFDKKLQESLFTFAVYPYPVSGSSIVLRAMSNATPVIASDIGGIKEYLNGGGIFIPPDNHKKLADVIESLLQNSLLREGLGTNGRQRAINYFAWDRVGETTINIYKQIMSAQEKE